MEDGTIENRIKSIRIIYTIPVVFIIVFFYLFFGTQLLEMIFGETAIVNPWISGLGQILFILIPSIAVLYPMRMSFETVYRLKLPGLKIFLVSLLGLLFIKLIEAGILSFQDYLITESFQEFYDKILIDYRHTIMMMIGRNDIMLFFRAVLILCFIPALSEEFLFRGFLMANLEMNIGRIKAVMISGLIFGLMHLNPVNLLPLIITGVFLGFMASFSRTIILPVILHFINNIISVSTFYFSDEESIKETFSVLPLSEAFFYLAIGITGLMIVIYYSYRFSKTSENPLQDEVQYNE